MEYHRTFELDFSFSRFSLPFEGKWSQIYFLWVTFKLMKKILKTSSRLYTIHMTWHWHTYEEYTGRVSQYGALCEWKLLLSPKKKQQQLLTPAPRSSVYIWSLSASYHLLTTFTSFPPLSPSAMMDEQNEYMYVDFMNHIITLSGWFSHIHDVL